MLEHIGCYHPGVSMQLMPGAVIIHDIRIERARAGAK